MLTGRAQSGGAGYCNPGYADESARVNIFEISIFAHVYGYISMIVFSESNYQIPSFVMSMVGVLQNEVVV